MLYAVFRHLETWSRTSSLKVVAPHLLNAGIPGGLQFCRSPRLRTTMRQRCAQSVCWRPFSPTYCTKVWVMLRRRCSLVQNRGYCQPSHGPANSIHDWWPLWGTLANLAASIVFWIALRNAKSASVRWRYFLLTSFAFNVFEGTGYFLFFWVHQFRRLGAGDCWTVRAQAVEGRPGHRWNDVVLRGCIGVGV